MTADPPAAKPPQNPPAMRKLRNRPGLGILMSLVATLLFSVLWVCVKALSERYSIYEVTFFRNFMAIFTVMAMLAPRRHWGLVRTRRIGGHVWRAVVSVIGMLLGFMSYHLMPLADAVALSFMSPLVVTALSVPLLKEKVGIHRWSAVVIGFIGVLVIVNPGQRMFSAGVLVSFCAALAGALATVTLRQLNRMDPPLTIVFYFTLFSTLFTALPLPLVWEWPGLADLGLLVVMGLTGGIGQYFITRAYGLAPASVIAPFGYSGLLWATAEGWVVWGDVPATHVFVGAAVVIASGLYILFHETRKRARAAEA